MLDRASIKGSDFQGFKLSGLTPALRRQHWHTAAEAPCVPSTGLAPEQNDEAYCLSHQGDESEARIRPDITSFLWTPLLRLGTAKECAGVIRQHHFFGRDLRQAGPSALTLLRRAIEEFCKQDLLLAKSRQNVRRVSHMEGCLRGLSGALVLSPVYVRARRSGHGKDICRRPRHKVRYLRRPD